MATVYHKKMGSLFPFQFIILGIILTIVGVLNLAGILKFPEKLVPNLVFVFIGVILLTSRSGIKLNIEKKLYKTYYVFLGICFGSWKVLPSIEHLSVEKIPTGKLLRGRRDRLILKEARYKLFIHTKSNQNILIARANHQEIRQEAEIFSQEFKVEVIDTHKLANEE